VSSGPIAELVVPYDDTRPLATAARRKRMVRSRIVSLVITVVFMVVVYVWQRAAFVPAVWILYGVALLVSLGWLLFAVLAYRRARRDLETMGRGIAVRIDRGGVVVGGVGAPWSQVRALTTATGGLGRSPVLRLEHAGGPPGQVPLDQIPTLPATLDSTARAYSGGRFGVDLRALDT
jgi:hypothetical protein